jgi:hypothetical protein
VDQQSSLKYYLIGLNFILTSKHRLLLGLCPGQPKQELYGWRTGSSAQPAPQPPRRRGLLPLDSTLPGALLCGTHLREMAERALNRFLTHLTVNEKVAGSTQDQALAAVLILDQHVLGHPKQELVATWESHEL